ncbi:MAG TPA: glycosyltransferase family 2 protein [Membranihabitans sp.]|nr:glycosyltransferase family 2 protein [Membranihabitans sp.]
MMKKISVIVPVLNDYKALYVLIQHLNKSDDRDDFEWIIVDGGSNVAPEWLIHMENVRWIHSAKKGRAVQMNLGARTAKHDILYFVHADTLPPLSFVRDINMAILRKLEVGAFRLKLDSINPLLTINSFITWFNNPFSGGGDQSLYILRGRFYEEGGFNERFSIMEDFEFVNRLTPKTGYHIIPKNILASSRKYTHNGYLRVNIANLKAFLLFKRGIDPDIIKSRYYHWLEKVDRDLE